MLNKALRFRDIDTLITFRTFIADLYQQLKVAQQETTEQSVIYVYRGQLISSEELDHIKSSVGRYVSMNSFFSTTLDRELAVFYLPCSGNVLENELHGVLFEIEVDQSVTDTKPYANISHLSSFEAEREVLFMLGSIFKIESVVNSNDTQTIIKLKLCNENDHHLKELSSYLKHNLSCGPTLVSLGNLLENMGEYEKAARCYRRQLDKPDKKNSYVTGCCYTGLGVIENIRGNYNSAIRYHIKALNINLRIPNNNENIVDNYNNLASAFKCRKNYKIALGYYNKCLKIQERMYKNESLKVAKTYVNIGIIYGEQEKYHDALKYQNYALKIQEKCLPADHFIIARTCGNIGVVHHKIKDYNKALLYYQKSLEILLKSLPDTHLCLALTYHNIGEAYQDTNELNLALQNYLKADQVYRYSLPPEHPDLLENKQYLEKIQKKLK
jgi:tetratricopeptide (TPR) repeat protein